MSRQIPEGMDINDVIRRRRLILGIPDTSTVAKQEAVAGTEEERGFFDMLKAMGGDIVNKIKETVELPELSKMETGINNNADPYRGIEPGSLPSSSGLLQTLAPSSVGAKAGLVRKGVFSRPKGAKVAEQVTSKVGTGAAAGEEVSRVYIQGTKAWSKTLSGPNPSQLNRVFDKLDDAGKIELRRGMIESLTENLLNMPRITKAAQRNLLSAAGRERLRITFGEMPIQEFTAFMSYLERGQWTMFRNMALTVSVLYPALRFGGAPVWKAITGGQ